MGLNPGTKFGPYEIQTPLGAGGMGEVYRAFDTRLHRNVAIKILPASFSSDPERLQRFTQESRATAALNHPNILAIHDIGDDRGTPYVVCELLEGETLRDRLRAGPLSSRKAVEYAQQIARGLAAAHEKDIVHRDLKPENIFLTNDGRAKILDFGLAKVTRPGAELSADAPTLQVATEAGTVLGTVGYMAPEQVRGKAADQRSDIFAFGAILYEMLSGKRAFHGDSSADTTSAILKEEPPDLSETNRNVSPALERIVRHCLEKNPEQRFHSASDVAFDLETLSGTSTGASMKSTQAVGQRRTPNLAYLAAAVALFAVTFYAGLFVGGRSAGNPIQIQQLTFRRGSMLTAAFAPDGRTMVYTAAWEGDRPEIFTTSEQSPESRSLEIKDATLLAISSTGEMAIKQHPTIVGPYARTGTLATVPLTGGSPRALLDSVEAADFSPDGSRMAVVQKVGGEFVLQYPIGKKLFSSPLWVSHARISPSGKLVVFLNHPYGGDEGSVMLADENGNVKELSKGWLTLQGLAWSPDGKEIWFTGARTGANRSLYAVTLEGKERLVSKIPGMMTLLAISPENRVLMNTHDDRYVAVAQLSGAKEEKDLSWFDSSVPVALSGDGKLLLIGEVGEGGGANYTAYLRPTDGSPAIRLGEGNACDLSSDAKYALGRLIGNPSRLFLLPTNGAPQELTIGNIEPLCGRFVPGTHKIVFVAREPGKKFRDYLLDPEAGGSLKAVTPEGVSGSVGTYSAGWPTQDGKIAAADAAGELKFYPLGGGTPEAIHGLLPGESVRGVSADGRTLFVSQHGELPEKVFRLDSMTGDRTFWKAVGPTDKAGTDHLIATSVYQDGNAYTYGYERDLSELYLFKGLK